ncbi:MAG: sigma-70 family RNA polymerase sigma factor [Isosphaeraceae bacterium]|nr:sigma-70 family RNA polymerase sigma factor [Isosphaeraceae bacterium]
MTGNDPSAVIRDVQMVFSLGAAGGLTDGQLLERFVARRDAAAEAAFAALVQRHGRMVWGVCRRTLNDPHAAADAFQATFLVLVRKAATVRVEDSLGRWLYGVSRKVAQRAKISTARRSARETERVETVAGSGPASDQSELLVELDVEIGRLPQKYRAAVVLCDLGGATHEEAARQLGCAVGTVGSRLARGRERLRERLTRRGLVSLTGLLGAGLSAETASAAAPSALLHATARAAVRVAAGEAALVTANVSAFSKGMWKAMLSTQLRSVAAFAAMAIAGVAVLSLGAAQEPKAPPAATKEEPPNGRATESPEQIIAKMVKTYATARSYEDEGEVTIVFTGPNGKRTVKRPFLTKFVRPKLYRYEFSERSGDGDDERNRFVIWSNAAPERSKTWWTLQPEIKEGPLAMAIGSGTGISGGSSFTVPNLLMPESIPGLPLTGLRDLELIGEEAVDETPCDKIEGKNIRGDTQTVWIDRATSLVRKIFTAYTVPGSAIQQTTTYRPRVNVAIAPKQFQLKPSTP